MARDHAGIVRPEARMTWLRSVRALWRRMAPVTAPAVSFVPTQTRSSVPAEYLSLHTYLEHRLAGVVVISFVDVEALLGFALPAAARTGREWWTVAASPADRHSEAWTAAHRTAVPNLAARNVTFERYS
jgi:hypothetical protein